MKWRERDGVRWLEADLDGARAVFSTRLGGVSRPPFDSLNVGVDTGDEPEAVAENRRRLAAALGLPVERLVYARQVHGTRLLDYNEREEGLQEADGHVVREAGPAAMALGGDCFPIALRGSGGLAIVHGGWRGLARGIVETAAAAVGATAAAVGPGIGPCCFDVEEEALRAFADLGEGVTQGSKLNLPEVVRRRLAEVGVERIEWAGLCTSCEPDLFFSYRRDEGRTGRQAGVAWLEE